MSQSGRRASSLSPRQTARFPYAKAIVSVLLIVHLTAVFIAPFSFATSSGPGEVSPAALWIVRPLRPYIDFAYLNHGYFFFAPNPGPSHLVRYHLEFAGDREPEMGQFPDLRIHQPRLLYHRYFMLSEWLSSRFVPPQPPAELTPGTPPYASWQTARESYLMFHDSYEQHLRAATGAERVRLTRREHRLPSPFEVGERKLPLSHPSLYADLPENPSPEEMRDRRP